MAKIPDVPREGPTHEKVRSSFTEGSTGFAKGRSEKSTVTSGGKGVFQGKGSKNSTTPISQPALKGTKTGHWYDDNPFPDKNKK